MTFALNPKAKLAANLFSNPDRVPARDGYGKGVVDAGDKNANVVVLCADLTESTRSNWFAEKYPQRFVECGAAEQNMLGLAGGLAMMGKIPFVSSYAAFNPGRNWDQLRVTACYSDLNVKIMGAHAGISVGPDGATHQALEDVAITRALPNITVSVPCDWIEARKATRALAEVHGPAYMRFGREKIPVITTEETPFTLGKAEVFGDGADVALIACGSMVYESLVAAQELSKEGISAAVLNIHTIKPIDADAIVDAAKVCGAVVTAEEHQVIGGLGSAVAEVLGENYPVPMKRVGKHDSFGESGKPQELLERHGMTSKHVIAAAKEVVKRKKR